MMRSKRRSKRRRRRKRKCFPTPDVHWILRRIKASAQANDEWGRGKIEDMGEVGKARRQLFECLPFLIS